MVLLTLHLRMDFLNHLLEEVVGIESCEENLWIPKHHRIAFLNCATDVMLKEINNLDFGFY